MLANMITWRNEQMRDLVPASLRPSAGRTWRRVLVAVANIQHPQGGALFLAADPEWFTNVVVKTFANLPSIATTASARPAGMKRFVGVVSTPLTATPGGPPFCGGASVAGC